MSWREEWEELRRDPQHTADILAEEAKNTLAARVYQLRKARNLSQAALAELVGTKQPNISGIELAETNVTIETLDELAAALEVSVADLFSLDDRADPAESAPSLDAASVAVEERALTAR